MLVTSRPKRDILSVLTDKTCKPVDARGFGLVVKFEEWLSKRNSIGCRNSVNDHTMHRPRKRGGGGSSFSMAVLLREKSVQEGDLCESPEEMLRRIQSMSTEGVEEDAKFKWRCRGCNTMDQKYLVSAPDSMMACSKCSVVACGVKMVSTYREKACSEEEDRTQHADAPKDKCDLFSGEDVETAKQTRHRHMSESGGCMISSKTRQKNGIGNSDSIIKKNVVAEYRAQQVLSQLNCKRNRALQIELVGLCKLVAPVDSSLQRHVRITAHHLLVCSQIHENVCSHCSCSVSLSGLSAGLIAKVLMRVMAETLLPLHGTEKCPFRFECSRDELVGLVERCSNLVINEGVHSALCRTTIDILLNGDCTTPCNKNEDECVDESITSGVILSKNESMDVMCKDYVNAVRDVIWAYSKTIEISDELRDAVLSLLRFQSVRRWIDKEVSVFGVEIVSLRLTASTYRSLNVKDAVIESCIKRTLKRLCTESFMSMGTFIPDTFIDKVVTSLDVATMTMNDDDDSLL